MRLLDLQGRRVLITQSDDFMGPALARVFSALGAAVTADARALGDEPDSAQRVIEEAGEVPLGRLVSGDEDVLFAAYLASDAAACFVGQVFPVCGGWVA